MVFVFRWIDTHIEQLEQQLTSADMSESSRTAVSLDPSSDSNPEPYHIFQSKSKVSSLEGTIENSNDITAATTPTPLSPRGALVANGSPTPPRDDNTQDSVSSGSPLPPRDGKTQDSVSGGSPMPPRDGKTQDPASSGSPMPPRDDKTQDPASSGSPLLPRDSNTGVLAVNQSGTDGKLTSRSVCFKLMCL